MKLHGSIFAAFAMIAALLASSAVGEDDKDKERGYPKGYKGHKESDKRPEGNWPRRDSNSSGFNKLSDEERTKIREALQQVWSDPEVIAARHELQQASEKYRETMRTALKDVDPEIQPILQKMMMMSPRGPGGPGDGPGNGPNDRPGGGGPGGREWGDPDQPGFARLVVKRVSMEIADRMEPELRGEFEEAHKQVTDTDEFKAALKTVEDTKDFRKKQDEARKLREVYRTELEKINPKFKKYFGRFPGGPHPPHGEGEGEQHPGPPHDGPPLDGPERPELES